MSNLFKKGSTISKSERIIDYNEIIKAKLQTILESKDRDSANPDGFVEGLTADVVEQLVSDGDETDAVALLSATSADDGMDFEEASQEAQRIIDEANQQADMIINEANERAEQMLELAGEQGYQQGIARAEEEYNIKLAEIEADYKNKEKNLEQEYQERKAKMEPELVEIITDIFNKIFLEAGEDDKDILINLVNNALSGAEKSREFAIKVSSDDYQFMLDNQGKIFCALSKEATIDIFEDNSLSQGKCIVETDGCVYDCSVDVELNKLIKKIKMLSWN